MCHKRHVGEPVGAGESKMDEKERAIIREALAKRTAEAAKSPEAAKARLVREGFYTPNGQLTPEYGGKRVAAR